jgi:hypothetical protein
MSTKEGLGIIKIRRYVQLCDVYVIHMFLLAGMQLYENAEVKKRVASAKPYGKWFSEGSRALEAASYLKSSFCL